jgi:hypothetical protein
MSEEKSYIQLGKYVLGFYSILVIVGITLYLPCGCSSINKKFGLDDDNVIEELFEDLIEQKTGLDIDLTPGSPE